jgi:hypothetical protein
VLTDDLQVCCRLQNTPVKPTDASSPLALDCSDHIVRCLERTFPAVLFSDSGGEQRFRDVSVSHLRSVFSDCGIQACCDGSYGVRDERDVEDSLMGMNQLRFIQRFPMYFRLPSGFTSQPMTLVINFSIGVNSGAMWNNAESSFQCFSHALRSG